MFVVTITLGIPNLRGVSVEVGIAIDISIVI